MYSRRGAQTIAFHICFRADDIKQYKRILNMKKKLMEENDTKFNSVKEIKEFLEYNNKHNK
jgi:hypothetical protein